MKKFITILTLSLSIGVTGAFAEDAMEEGHGEHAAAHEEGGHHGHHSSHLSVFAGASTFFELNETAFTAGLDYEYRLPFLNGLLGVGALGDFSFLAHETSIIAAGFIGIHPFEGLKILVAPGVEIVSGEVETITEFLIRGSIGYDIMISNFSITPIVSFDYVPTTGASSIVYGVAAGIGF